MAMKILQGDCRDCLRQLPEKSVHLCVTSPPYFGLRSYGTDPVRWGGDMNCEHEWKVVRTANPNASGGKSEIEYTNDAARSVAYNDRASYTDVCERCGCWRGELGQEPSIDLYVRNLVEVFREVQRVLRDDGVFFLNIGDSYYHKRTGGVIPQTIQKGNPNGRPSEYAANRTSDLGLDGGNLLGIPWRVAFALQEDGWILRSDSIWSKPQGLPESVRGWRWEQHKTKIRSGKRGEEKWRAGSASDSPQSDHDPDSPTGFSEADYEPCPGCKKCEPNGGLVLRKGAWRPTRAHEYVFMFVKTDTYFADQEAVRNAYTTSSLPHLDGDYNGSSQKDYEGAGVQDPTTTRKSIMKSMRETRGSNLRSVWKVNTGNLKEGHFASYPEELVRICVLAGSAEEVCLKCGTPWAPVLEASPNNDGYPNGPGGKKLYTREIGEADRSTLGDVARYDFRTFGNKPTCRCGAPSGPSTVLDPFLGSGTTALVARRLGRHAIGCELNPKYVEIAERRTDKAANLFEEEFVEAVFKEEGPSPEPPARSEPFRARRQTEEQFALELER